MSKAKILIGIALILLGVYTPIGLFNNIPPFNTSKNLYIYSVVEEPNSIRELPGLVYPQVKEPEVETTILIEKPDRYNLVLRETVPYIEGNLWFIPSVFVSMFSLVGGTAILIMATQKDRR